MENFSQTVFLALLSVLLFLLLVIINRSYLVIHCLAAD